MMKTRIALLAATLVPLTSARADETIPVRHVGVDKVVSALVQKHLKSLSIVVLPDNQVTLQGNDADIAKAKAEITVVDVKPRMYSVRIQVIRCVVSADGKGTDHVVLAPLISLLEGDSFHSGAEASQGISLTTTTGPEDSIHVAVDFHFARERGDVALWASAVRDIPSGKTERVLGVTDNADKELRKAVRQGKVVTNRGAYEAYYLDVTPERIDHSAGAPA